MKVMIVDDNAKMRETIRKFLAPMECDVMECSSGAEAFAAYGRFLPDWVLMDIRMPGMDGIAVTEKLRRSFPDARVVIVTEYGDDRHRRVAKEAGVYGFVSKENMLDLNEFLQNSEIR